MADGKAAGDNQLVKDCNARIKVLKSKYNDLTESVGLQKAPERMARLYKDLTRRKVNDIIPVKLPDGTMSQLTKFTEIKDIEVFAGEGAKEELRVRDFLAMNYGGSAEKWQHTKGRGFVDTPEGSKRAMLHWFEEETVGIKEMFVKGWSKK